ncbi:polysaccharide deacetylase family protein [Paenibacillus sp. NPDC058174]|uniref:polysaccharide deacetylase family protein n=1 Tax=Paenibacillus sp. NPDC058174 TaxID=3346366 RepID=UPI0036DDE524
MALDLVSNLQKYSRAVLLTAAILIPIQLWSPGSAAAASVFEHTKIEAAHGETTKKKEKAKARKPDMSWSKLQKQFPGTFVIHGPRNKKRVALTFDDAPDSRFTPAVLDVLAKYDVCATFFVVGSRAAQKPDLVRRMSRECHAVGNHSYNHAVMSKLSKEAFRKQISRTDAIVNGIIGYHPRYIRPPYGEILPAQVAWAKKNQFVVVNWDVDSVDWRNNPSTETVLRNIRRTLQPGSIILQHAGGGSSQDLSGTVNALPRLISSLRQKGYEFVTLPELLGKPAYKNQK